MLIVTYFHKLNSTTYYLRGTNLTEYRDRAQEFADEATARAAIAKAKPFHKASVLKTFKVEVAQPPVGSIQ